MRYFFGGALIFFLVFNVVTSGFSTSSVEIALQLSREGKISEAIDILMVEAERGDSIAQIELDYIFEHVDFDKINIKKYLINNKVLAEQGSALAQYYVGLFYMKGFGVEQDLFLAAKWLRLSAEQGNPLAQLSLGVLLNKGRGIKKNESEAVKFYRMSAEQGVVKAMIYLGMMYESGEGVSVNYVEAAKWYSCAAVNGSAEAQYKIGQMYSSGKGVTLDNNLAKKFYTLSANQGYLDALNILAPDSPEEIKRRDKKYRMISIKNEELSKKEREAAEREGIARAARKKAYREKERYREEEKNRENAAARRNIYGEKEDSFKHSSNSGATNTSTGEYLAPAGEGYVGSSDGSYYMQIGPNQLMNTSDGEIYQSF